jgi:hypothetical protein
MNIETKIETPSGHTCKIIGTYYKGFSGNYFEPCEPASADIEDIIVIDYPHASRFQDENLATFLGYSDAESMYQDLENALMLAADEQDNGQFDNE